MKIAARELNLLFITLGVLLLALTYVALAPKFAEWAEFRSRREDLLARRETAQQLLDSRPAVETRLAEFRAGVPVFPAGKRAESELMPALEKMAGQHNLVLTKRTATAEREAGDLYETTINCDWEGDLDALVNFLYTQQTQGAVSDVRQLTVQPFGGRDVPAGRLRGNFSMDYAYRREAGAPESKPEPAGETPPAAAAQP